MTTEAEIIKVLAEEKNMRKAAERLFLTQPALSQRLQSIEKEWGAQIVYSFTKRINPNTSGRISHSIFK